MNVPTFGEELQRRLVGMLEEAPGYDIDLASALGSDPAYVAVALRQLEVARVVERFDDAFGAWYRMSGPSPSDV